MFRRRRRGYPDNAATERARVYVGDPIAAARVAGTRRGTVLDPTRSRAIVWGLQGSPAVTFGGVGPTVQRFTRLGVAANTSIAQGFNTALPGTGPPVGAYPSATRDALRARQAMLSSLGDGRTR
jgi:hypothetical protein